MKVDSDNWNISNNCSLDSWISTVVPEDVCRREGHSTMIAEIREQLRGERPSCVVTCVGGGGLLYGVLRGLDAAGWADVPVVAMETPGAASFHASVQAGRLVTLEKIDTVATCLGALTVIPELLGELATHTIFSELVPDRETINACLRFADDHRMLVEPACGATLAAIYSGVVSRLRGEGRISTVGPTVVIVCGGVGVDTGLLQGWKQQFGLDSAATL
ncbi:SDS [Cordylochernes scorpioides]|uniref:L-serine ammonia-lyase n=1 Tax=Cordylochernes scorpioides TaxID=51811 RepID=A0ABY6K5B2_9ARAC|nr:SDS [Cordylochernes scorpioides]